jgi:uncharacterized Zn finger protein (UPF0148 family)
MSKTHCPKCEKPLEIEGVETCPHCNFQLLIFLLEDNLTQTQTVISKIESEKADLLERLTKLESKGYLLPKESDTERKSIEQEFKNKLNPFEKTKKNLETQIEKENSRIEVEKRTYKILSGNISPISTSLGLQENEKAYYIVSAQRIATFTEINERTEIKTDNSGALTRGCGCGCLFGWIGALLGALSANSKSTARVIRESHDNEKIVDTGYLIMTNKRIIFNGQNILSINYSEILEIRFEKRKDINLIMKYPSMLNKEYFNLYGTNSNDCDIFYKGITNNLLYKSSKKEVE